MDFFIQFIFSGIGIVVIPFKHLKIAFAQNAPELSLWGSSQLKNYLKILIYIQIPSISGDITKNVKS